MHLPKLLRIMKITAFLLLTVCLQVAARTEGQTLTLSMKNVPVKQVLREIQKQTGLNILVDEALLQNNSMVSLQGRNLSLQEVLERCFDKQSFIYAIENGALAIKPRITAVQVAAPVILLKIQGRVTDEQGHPLSSASVRLKGSDKGAATDADGNFTLEVPGETAVLVISYIGYQSQELTVSNANKLNIVLKPAATTGEEVVIIGYGTRKRSQLIGSVSQINADKVNNRTVTQLSNALAGQMPGVTVIQRSGQPGASGGNIQIRGVGSFGAGTGALILIDGIPANSFNDVDPNDVENISVLKDASSAAIYGARAANGVILVTTKTGKGEKLKVSYNGYVGTQKATAYPEFARSWEYATMLNEAQPGAYTDAQIQKYKDGSDPDNYPDMDYIDLVFKKSTLQTGHNISFSNNNRNTAYQLSFGYLSQNGIVAKNNYNRYNIRLNITNTLAPNLKLTSRLSAIQTQNDEPAPPATLDFDDMINAISNVIRTPAIYANKLSNGDWGPGVVGKGTPVSYLDNASFYKYKGTDLAANLRLDWNVIPDLKLSLIGGYTALFENSKRFLASQRINANVTLGPSNLNQSSANSNYKTLQQLAEYRKQINRHEFSLMAGHSFEAGYSESLNAFRNDFPGNDLTQLNAGGVTGMTNAGTASEWALDSYFGRLQYNYANKYLVEGVLRYDGSSRFPENEKYAVFPSAAVGWRIGEEGFVKNNFDFIDELKLKASYGILGNQNIGNYPYQNILAPGYNYAFGNVIGTGVARTTITDTTLRWESTRTSDIGIEASILKGLIAFSVTYFDKYTYDILVSPSASVSNVLGFNSGVQNTGKLKNTGWEFTIAHKKRFGKFSYSVDANFSIINNKVTDLGVGNVKQPNGLVGNGSSLFIGHPMNLYYGYVSDGLFTNQAEITNWANMAAIFGGTVNSNVKPGDIRYRDISGPDGKPDGIVNAAYDRVVLGSTIPKYSYGINLGANYNGFDFAVLLQGVAGVKGNLNNYAGWAFYQNGSIQKWQMDERWTSDNPRQDAKYPRLEIITNQGTPNTQLSSYWMLNSAYLRIKNIQLGYNLPGAWLKKAHIGSLRIYANAENLFTFSNYRKGWDPEINTGGSYYPILANYTLGVNVNF
jgi:TonB-linked SusC/RagA family outer membrane protein